MPGKILPPVPRDLRELLRFFNDHEVRYLIAGAVAVGHYAQPRYTKDLDLFVKPDTVNAKSVFRALAAFGAPLDGITISDLQNPKNFFRFGHPPIAFDILPGLLGVDFDTAWQRRVVVYVDEAETIQANVLAAEDVIVSKLASGRPHDLGDVDSMRKAAKVRP